MSKLKRMHERVKGLEAELSAKTQSQISLTRKIEELEGQCKYLGGELTKANAYGVTLEGRLIPYEGTPANRRAHTGEEDPFANYLDKERADLALGHLTDDEIANAIFMNYDVFPSIQDLASGKGMMPIVYMTGGKERIRWLSRQVTRLQQELLAKVGNTPIQGTTEA